MFLCSHEIPEIFNCNLTPKNTPKIESFQFLFLWLPFYTKISNNKTVEQSKKSQATQKHKSPSSPHDGFTIESPLKTHEKNVPKNLSFFQQID